ncbi:MAG: hypothetical protein QXX64_06080 [Nitrososphaera sp.]
MKRQQSGFTKFFKETNDFQDGEQKITCYYQDFDLINNKRISKLTSSCIISIFTGMLAREEVKDIVKLMRQERLCGTGSKCAARLIPSYALDGKGFCAERYWRGPF